MIINLDFLMYLNNNKIRIKNEAKQKTKNLIYYQILEQTYFIFVYSYNINLVLKYNYIKNKKH